MVTTVPEPSSALLVLVALLGLNSLLKKRLFSSPAAFASTMEKHHSSLVSEKPKAKADPMSERILKKAIQKADEDYADDALVEEAQTDAVEAATKQTAPLTAEEKQLFEKMRTWAQRAKNRTDTKAQAIIDWIEANLKTKGKWNDKRVILFTEYRTTHQWLFEILASQGYGGERLAIIHGSMDQEER